MSKINIHDLHIEKSYPQFILCSRLDFTLSTIKYLIPQHIRHEEILCIHTAALVEDGHDDNSMNLDKRTLEHLGTQIDNYDISNKNKKEVEEKLQLVKVLFIRGGNTAYLLECMRNCNFEEILHKKIDEGMIYIGASAGAIVCCEDIDFIKPMDQFEKSTLTNFKGFNEVPFRIIPHSNTPEFKEIVEEIIENNDESLSPLFKLKEEQVLCIYKNNTYKIF